jgi:glutamyl-tRNA synthetase
MGELRSLAVWSTASISDAITSYCAATGLSMGQIGPPLRAALTGGLPAPDLAPVMDWLGREESLGRIEDQIAAAAGTSAADN